MREEGREEGRKSRLPFGLLFVPASWGVILRVIADAWGCLVPPISRHQHKKRTREEGGEGEGRRRRRKRSEEGEGYCMGVAGVCGAEEYEYMSGGSIGVLGLPGVLYPPDGKGPGK